LILDRGYGSIRSWRGATREQVGIGMQASLINLYRVNATRSGRALLLPAVLSMLVSALLVGCGGTSAATAPALFMFRDGLGNFGLYRGDGPLVALDATNGHLIWRRQQSLPTGVANVGAFLRPTMQEEMVYVPASYRDLSQPALYYAELAALDPMTGQERWRHRIPQQQDANSGLESIPVVADGVVYLSAVLTVPSVAGQTPTLHSLVEALDSHTGAVRWTTTLLQATSAPALADGRVMVLSGNKLLALDSHDGSVLWTFAPPGHSFVDLQSGNPPVTTDFVVTGDPGPFAAQHLVMVEATEADVAGHGLGSTWFAVNTSDGSLAWRSTRSAPGAVVSRPAVDESGCVLCVSAYTGDGRNSVTGLSLTSGTTLWTVPTSAAVSVCGTAGELFYLIQGDQAAAAGGLLALDSRTGRQVWHTSTKFPSAAFNSGVAAPLQRHGLAAMSLPGRCTEAGCANDTIAVVQLTTGDIVWQRDFSPLSGMPVTIEGDQVIVPQLSHSANDVSSQVVAYALQTGSQAWTYTLGQV
jgi:outer membrane protein assembly factor BamB